MSDNTKNKLDSLNNDLTDSDSSKEDTPSSSKKLTRRDFLKKAGLAAGMAATSPMYLGKRVYAQTSRPMKLGVLLPYSGIYSVLGESITNGMELYFDQIGWEAGGRKIEIVQNDTEMDPGTALSRSRRLIQREQVDMVAGIVSSAVLKALRSFYQSQQTLLISANAGSPALSRKQKTPYIWRTSFTNWQPPYPMAAWAAQNIGKRGMISVHDYAAGHDVMESCAHAFEEVGGGEIVGVQKLPFPDIGDPAPFMADIQDKDPDVVLVFYAGSAAVKFVNAFDDFGLKGNIALSGSGFFSSEDVMPSQGSSAVGNKSGLHWAYQLPTPANREFKKEFEKKAGRSANVYGVQGYDTARTIHELMKTLGGDTSNTQDLIDLMPTVSFTSPRGPFSIDKKSQSPKHNIYIREARKIGDSYHNVVLENTGPIVDPGNNSKDKTPNV